MSTDTANDHSDDWAVSKITLLENPDGWWTAVDDETGAVSQGPTEAEAIENVREAARLIADPEFGREPTDEELRDMGIDPDAENTSGPLPEVLR